MPTGSAQLHLATIVGGGREPGSLGALGTAGGWGLSGELAGTDSGILGVWIPGAPAASGPAEATADPGAAALGTAEGRG